MKNNEAKRNICSLIIFAIIVLSCGWIGVFIDTLLPNQSQGNTLGMLIWLVLPFVLSIALRFFDGNSWKNMGFSFNFKNNIMWYLISLIIFPLITLIILIFGNLMDWIDLSGFEIKKFLPIFIGGVFTGFVKNFFEESIWRGYLTNKLLKLNLKDFWLYIIIGSIWGLWHLPYNLVFLPLESIQSVFSGGRLSFTLISLLTTMSLTIMYTEIYRLTKSIWPLIILHTVANALINPLVIDRHIVITPQTEILISPVVGAIPLFLYFIIGLLCRYHRKKYISET